MRRREFIIGIAGSAFAGQHAAAEQARSRKPLIGFLHYGSAGASPEVDAFREGLRELGYIDGLNIFIEVRYAGGRIADLPQLATELVRLKPDAIITPLTPASLAAKQATSTIPIIFAGIADAVGSGLISNVSHPGGNITGLTSVSADLGGKRLEYLKAFAPHISRVAVLYNPNDRANVLTWEELEKAAPALGLTLQPLGVKGPDEFEGAFVAMIRERADGLFGAAGVLTFQHRKTLVDLAVRNQLPTMWGHRQFVDAGGLMSYAVNFYDQCRRAASYVDKVLKGERPGDLPVQWPTKFEFMISLRAASALGRAVPTALLALADEVVE